MLKGKILCIYFAACRYHVFEIYTFYLLSLEQRCSKICVVWPSVIAIFEVMNLYSLKFVFSLCFISNCLF